MNQAHQRSAGAGKAGGNARTSLQQHCLLKRSCCVVRRALCPSAGASFARLGWSRARSLPCERRTSCFAPQSASARAACRCLSCAPLRTCASACAAPGGSAHQRPGCAMVTDAAYQHRLSSRHSRAASGAPEWHTAASAHARRRQDSESGGGSGSQQHTRRAGGALLQLLPGCHSSAMGLLEGLPAPRHAMAAQGGRAGRQAAAAPGPAAPTRAAHEPPPAYGARRGWRPRSGAP